MNKEVITRLKELNIEDFIWLIYLGIIFFSYYSNHLERLYFLSNKKEYKEKYRKIMIIIFSVLLVVYLYFLKDSFDSLKNLSNSDSDKKKKLVMLSFLASLFIAISGFIFLYIAYKDDDLNVEIAFN